MQNLGKSSHFPIKTRPGKCRSNQFYPINVLFGKNVGLICRNYLCSVKLINQEKTLILSVYSIYMHKLRI
ncbi:MAG: hypothetical protein ACLPVJ_10765, partial [Syntrophobacteraceae bacterium]